MLEISEDVGGRGGSGAAADACFVASSSTLQLELAAVLLSAFTLVLGLDLDLNLISSFGAGIRPGLDFDAGLRLGRCLTLG